MEYETVQPEDLETCAGIYAQVFSEPPWNEPWTAASALPRLREIHGTPGFRGLKAVRNGHIVGFVMGYAESCGDRRDFYLKEMCVLPMEQGQGVGTALLDALVQALPTDAVGKIYLLTARESPAARFYAQCGFYVSDRMIMMGRRLG